MIASNKHVIEGLFDTRIDMELKYMQKKAKQSQDYMDEISKMLIKDSEEYHKLKVSCVFWIKRLCVYIVVFVARNVAVSALLKIEVGDVTANHRSRSRRIFRL